jgi:hypothetical protein
VDRNPGKRDRTDNNINVWTGTQGKGTGQTTTSTCGQEPRNSAKPLGKLWRLRRKELEWRSEEKERRIVRMQRLVNIFFALNEKDKPSMTVEDIRDTHTQKDRPSQGFGSVNIEPVVPGAPHWNGKVISGQTWRIYLPLKNETQKPVIYKNNNLAISEDKTQTQRIAEPKLDTATQKMN